MAEVILPASAGGTVGAWEHIETQVLASAAASFSFTGIDAAFRMFRLTCYIIKDANAGQVELRLNNDSGGNYNQQYMNINHATRTSARNAGLDSLRVTNFDNLAANGVLLAEILIAKQIAGQEGRIQSQASYEGSADPMLDFVVAQWANTADLINRIDIVESSINEFAIGSRVVLEGTQTTP